MAPHVGQIINGKYRLVRLIGEGGMGSVFEAKHEYLGSTVALKFLNQDLAGNPSLVQRFLQEGRVSASIQSPHVVRVSDVDQSEDGVPYLVMELLRGENLSAALSHSAPLPMNLALDYAVQVLNGLSAAHARGVVHRDLKPDNVFLVPMAQGQLVKLLDFGIAKLKLSDEVRKGLTAPGVFMGTPAYMAPEQMFSASTADPRSDLFSMSVILFEMLSGRRPFLGDDPQLVAAAIIASDRPDLHELNSAVPPELSDAVQKCLAAEPSDRFSSAVEFRDVLLQFFQPSVFASGIATMQDANLAELVPTPLAPMGEAPNGAETKGQTLPEAPSGMDAALPSTRPLPLESTAPGTSPSAALGAELGPDVRATGTVVGGAPSPGLYDGSLDGTAPTADMNPLPTTQPDLLPARPVKRSSPLKWVILSLLLVILAVAAVLLALLRPWEPEHLPPALTIPVPSATLDAGLATPVDDGIDAGSVPVAPTTTPTSTPTHHHPRRDAGHGAPPPPLIPSNLPPMPSNLPPMPSNLPPIPSTLPPMPSGFPPIQIPGWPPAK